MNGEFIIIALVVAVAMLVLWIAKLTAFLRAFSESAGRLCCQMDCAGSYSEYCRLRRKLRCHYLMLIPFVNEKNVERVYRFFFRKDGRDGKKERKDGIAALLMPSILGICICLVCVCGMTWAWYSMSVQAPSQKLTAAHYEVAVESVVAADNNPVAPAADGYDLQAETTYTVELIAKGTATEYGGYCLIQENSGSVTYYTEAFKPDEKITIRFTPSEAGKYTFTGVWGSHPTGVSEEIILKNTERTDAENPTDTPTADPDAILPIVDESSDPTVIPLIGEIPLMDEIPDSEPGPVPEQPSEESGLAGDVSSDGSEFVGSCS